MAAEAMVPLAILITNLSLVLKLGGTPAEPAHLQYTGMKKQEGCHEDLDLPKIEIRGHEWELRDFYRPKGTSRVK
jgi:hypothetical protein